MISKIIPILGKMAEKAKHRRKRSIDQLADNDIEILPITFEHLQWMLTLEFHHRDPFDRIIISQGLVERLTIASKDEHFPG